MQSESGRGGRTGAKSGQTWLTDYENSKLGKVYIIFIYKDINHGNSALNCLRELLRLHDREANENF